ncbi:hypothetical protein NESM_000328100 [Novymonas esmeraldas]|uniref:Uncharacterized protein n=1 Tax=Novymonas esmeraldas TaxID=1808958 RepID=A0AAW0EK63_9TRYP
MGHVCLLDVSHLAHRSPDPSRAASPPPPLAWWCAAELAQWCSATAVCDAWEAVTAATGERAAVAACASRPERDGYVRLGNCDDDADGSAASAAVPRRRGYELHRFPSQVPIHTKYFSTALTLTVGAPPRHPSEDNGGGGGGGVTHLDVDSAELLQSCASLQDRAGYGGVLVARVSQDPAEVPWHVFPAHGCLFHAVLVVLDEARVGDGAAPRRPAQQQQQQEERWMRFAVDNGYECILHDAVYLPPPATSSSAAAVIQMESVSPAAGRRGLLDAPLAGSSRLYQLLCNTLWPAATRAGGAAAPAGREASPHAGRAANALAVVGNDVRAMWRLFAEPAPSPRHCGARALRRRQRHFTAASDTTAETGGVALVNRYYAAAVQPRLVQTALFNARMQELLARFWEQNLLDGNGVGNTLCLDAPALVLWPPTSAERHGGGDGGGGGDAPTAYPPLESVLDSLRRLGCVDAVVVVVGAEGIVSDSCTGGQQRRSDGLTPYEAQMCVERGVEVIQLDAPCSEAVSDSDEEAVDDAWGVAVPVLCSDDDVSATRGLDRLHEILHCVQWGQTHVLPGAGDRAAASTSSAAANTCCLVVAGQTAVEEEAWVREVLAALSAPPPGTHVLSATTPCGEHLRLTAPTVAAGLGLLRGSDSTNGAPSVSESPFIGIEVVSRYCTSRVHVHVDGGLWSHHTAASPAWTNAHDAYVVVSSLHALQDAARVWATPSQHTSTSTWAGGRTLGNILRTLAQRQRDEWLTDAITAHLAAAADGCELHDAAADQPLVLLYVADVTAAAAARVALVERALRTLVRHADAAVEDTAEAGCDVEEWMPIEVVYAATAATDERDGAAFAVDGSARVREALEQHLWPHRQRRQPPPGPPRRPPARSSSGAFAGVSTATPDADMRDVAATSTRPPQTSTSAAVTVSPSCRTGVAEHAVSGEAALGMDVAWCEPLVGCALPPSYLVDPETLRSVSVLVTNARVPAVADGSPACGTSTSSNTAQQRQGLEAALMLWMEKMKQFGHRLGDARRKDQAAALALALQEAL